MFKDWIFVINLNFEEVKMTEVGRHEIGRAHHHGLTHVFTGTIKLPFNCELENESFRNH